MIVEYQTIGYVDLNPTKGNEINKKRPVLVISSTSLNKRSKLAVVLPITSSNNGYPLDVELSEFDKKGNRKKVSGVVLTEQVRTIDVNARGFTFVEYASDVDMKNVKEKIEAVFEDLFSD